MIFYMFFCQTQWSPRSILLRLVMLGGDFETDPGDAVRNIAYFYSTLKACSLIFRHFFGRIWGIGPMDRIDNSISSFILERIGVHTLYGPNSQKKTAKNKRAGLDG